MEEFKSDMGNPGTNSRAAVTTCFAGGAAVGALLGGLADWTGRKAAIVVNALISILGVMLLVVSKAVGDPVYALILLFVGRFISGFAVGQICCVVPMYQSEIAPRATRGQLITFWQLSVTLGIVTAFWMNLTLYDVPNGWVWVCALQALPAVFLALGMVALPESPRWLLLKRRVEHAKRALRQLRHADREQMVLAEFEEMQLAIEADLAQSRIRAFSRRRGRAHGPLGGGGGGGAPSASSSATAGGVTVKLSAALLAMEVSNVSETERVASPRAVRRGGGLAAGPSSRHGCCSCGSSVGRSARTADEWSADETLCDWFESALDCGVGSWLDFVTKQKLRRTALIGIGVAMLQQLVGTNAILYYGASLLPGARFNKGTGVPVGPNAGWGGRDTGVAFAAADGHGNTTLLSASKPPQLIVLGIVGVVNVVGTIVPLVLIDRVGRRLLLLVGSALMSVSFLSVGVLLNVYGQTVLDVDSDHDSGTVVSTECSSSHLPSCSLDLVLLCSCASAPPPHCLRSTRQCL